MHGIAGFYPTYSTTAMVYFILRPTKRIGFAFLEFTFIRHVNLAAHGCHPLGTNEILTPAKFERLQNPVSDHLPISLP